MDGITNVDGVRPNAGLVQGSDGNFYGMAEFGGTGGTGTIFQVTPQGAFTTLLSFRALDDGNYNTGGAYPTKSLIQGRDGSFYGTTGFGGTMAAGIAFKVTAAGNQTTLHTFGTLDASYPSRYCRTRSGRYYACKKRLGGIVVLAHHALCVSARNILIVRD